MTTPYPDDPMMRNLGRLRPLVPDPSHAERVRARCHAQLGQKRRRWERSARLAESARGVLAPAVLGGVCVLYVAALVGTAFRLRDALRW
jgi:hypothetical protein